MRIFFAVSLQIVASRGVRCKSVEFNNLGSSAVFIFCVNIHFVTLLNLIQLYIKVSSFTIRASKAHDLNCLHVHPMSAFARVCMCYFARCITLA